MGRQLFIQPGRLTMKPEEYSAFLGKTDLAELQLLKVEANCRKALGDWKGQLEQLKVGIGPAFTDKEGNHLLPIQATLAVSFFPPDEEAKVEKPNQLSEPDARVSITYGVILRAPEPFPPEFGNLYSSGSLMLNVWPYFRELVHSLTGKMTMRPALLPLHKTPPSSGRKAKEITKES